MRTFVEIMAHTKEQALAYQRKRYRERVEYIAFIKEKSNGCTTCGYNKFPRILQFHHRDRKNKGFNISGSRLANRSIEKLKEEIAKCDLLCPNCHSEKHMNDGNFHGGKNIAGCVEGGISSVS